MKPIDFELSAPPTSKILREIADAMDSHRLKVQAFSMEWTSSGGRDHFTVNLSGFALSETKDVPK